MIKDKNKKDKIVEARLSISLLSGIKIKEKDRFITIGGFSIDGGFYLKSPYTLVKEETKSIVGDVTYYNFIKSSKKMCEQEKGLRKIENDKKNFEKRRKKELEKELKRLEKK